MARPGWSPTSSPWPGAPSRLSNGTGIIVIAGVAGVSTRKHPTDRAKLCPACGLTTYPRLSPSIIVLVRNGEEMLLARNAAWPTSMYSTLAGFVEPGEAIEQTVHREVAEEVGVSVKNLRYLGSQSWPFPNSLMLGFHADYAGGDIVYHDGEIADARWFHYRHLPNVPGGTAISRWLIDAFVDEDGQRGRPLNGRPAERTPSRRRCCSRPGRE